MGANYIRNEKDEKKKGTKQMRERKIMFEKLFRKKLF